jgi:6-phosphogluconolactonase
MRPALWLLLAPAPLWAAAFTGWIGTYTSHGSASTGSLGIYSFEWDSAGGVLHAVRAAGMTTNPSFLALHPSGHFLYAVNEDASASGADRITAFAVGRPGSSVPLRLLGSVSSMGRGPCHLSVHPSGRWLFVANYQSGSIAVYPIQADGRLGQAGQMIQQQAVSPQSGQPLRAHAHEVVSSADGHFLLSVDLGLDRIFVYRFDAASGMLTANQPAALSLPSGYGPRHLLFSKDARMVYAVTEPSARLIALRWDARRGSLTQLAELSTLPAGYDGQRSGAEIALHANGRFLYTSNRGQSNSIAMFRIGRDGLPVSTGWVAAGGMTPRFIGIDPSGRYLIAANQDSGTLVIFNIDAHSGVLTAKPEPVTLPAPVDVLFARQE